MTQKNFILNLSRKNPDAIFVGSLGTISQDLADIPHEHKVITKGAMGCVMGIGLGLAMHTDKEVFVLIGDGSFIMKMGSISTILRYNPRNLHVIIINNNSYASCGGQATNFRFVNDMLPRQFQVVKVTERIYFPMTVNVLTKGHILCLEELSKRGEVVVGLLNTKALEGYKKELMPFEDRYFILQNATKKMKHVRIVAQDSLDPTENLINWYADALASGDGFEPIELAAVDKLKLKLVHLTLPGENGVKQYSSSAIAQ